VVAVGRRRSAEILSLMIQGNAARRLAKPTAVAIGSSQESPFAPAYASRIAALVKPGALWAFVMELKAMLL
jgi:hypothetical protein